jgi:hypothetical protein
MYIIYNRNVMSFENGGSHIERVGNDESGPLSNEELIALTRERQAQGIVDRLTELEREADELRQKKADADKAQQ